MSESLVYIYLCFPDDKVWTVVNHNSTEMVRVQGSSLQKPHVMKFNYSASLEQLRTLVGRSEQCQQEVVYLCRKSRLFNTWGGYWTSSAICVLWLEFLHLIFLYYSISALFQLTVITLIIYIWSLLNLKKSLTSVHYPISSSFQALFLWLNVSAHWMIYPKWSLFRSIFWLDPNLITILIDGKWRHL